MEGFLKEDNLFLSLLLRNIYNITYRKASFAHAFLHVYHQKRNYLLEYSRKVMRAFEHIYFLAVDDTPVPCTLCINACMTSSKFKK